MRGAGGVGVGGWGGRGGKRIRRAIRTGRHLWIYILDARARVRISRFPPAT